MSECIHATYPEYNFGNDGYPRLYNPKIKNMSSAVRVIWEAVNGPIPDDHEPDHLCKNILCVNLDHIEIVTATENKSRVARKLTAEQVREIRKRLGTVSNRQLATEFGVTDMTIGHIARGKNYRWVV